MAYPQYNSVVTIDPGADTTGRYKAFTVTGAGNVHVTTMNGEDVTLAFATADISRVIPIGIRAVHNSGTTVAGLFGLN